MDVIGRLVMRPPILQLTFHAFLYYIVGPILFKDKCFIAFLGDPWVKHLESLYKYFIFPWNGGQPLLGSIHPKIPRDKKMEGNNDGKW